MLDTSKILSCRIMIPCENGQAPEDARCVTRPHYLVMRGGFVRSLSLYGERFQKFMAHLCRLKLK